MFDKLNTLYDILIGRLIHIKRWSRVGIYFPGDDFPKDTISEEDIELGFFYVLWYRPRRKGSPNPYEYKKIPLSPDDLDGIIKRQREKLRTESENA